MARKRKEEAASAGAPEWMATYSDLVTLLFCFFVLLYAMSKPDPEKLKMISESIAASDSLIDWAKGDSILDSVSNGILRMPMITESGKGGENKKDNSTSENADEAIKEMESDLSVLRGDFESYFPTENPMNEAVKIDATEQSIILSLGDMLFDSGSDSLRDEAVEVLNVIAGVLARYQDFDIHVEGHTDDRPINTVRFPDNWWLSYGRALSVGKYFAENFTISPDRITISGYGEYRPLDPSYNSTPEGRLKNRRVEIRIVKKVNESEVVSNP